MLLQHICNVFRNSFLRFNIENTVVKGHNSLFILISFLFMPVEGVSQNSGFTKISDHQYIIGREFTTENGLPGNGVNSIYQDQSGYIWAATYNGLVRYNGTRFATYNSSNVEGLRTNRFLQVTGDREGRIWAGLEYNSLIVLDQAQDSTSIYIIEEQEQGLNRHVLDISFGIDNTPWIGTNRGIMLLQNGGFVSLDHLPRQTAQNIIHTDQHTYILFQRDLYRLHPDGRIDKKLLELREDKIYSESGVIDEFTDIVRLLDFQMIDGAIYLLHEAGMVKIEDENYEVVLHRKDAGQTALHGFLVHDDKFYINGLEGMFAIENFGMDDEQYIYYTRQSTNDILIDHEGSVWIATTANGLNQYVSTPIFQGDAYNVLRETAITATLTSATGSLLVGTNCDGLYEFNGDNIRHFSLQSGFRNTCIWSLMEQENGTVWAGTWGGGVYYRRPGSEMFEQFDPEIFEEIEVFLSIFEDSAGNIWFGTYNNGLYRFDGTQTESITNISGETLSAIRTIYEDGESFIVATDQGIGFLSNNEIVEFEEIDLLETSNFRTITRDDKGRFWFGSYGGGLVVYEPGGQIRTITGDNGLYDDTISQTAFDDDGNLWLGGNLGVFYIERDQIERYLEGAVEKLRISRLGVKEGMTIRETTGGFMPSSQLTSDGKLFIPTVQGLNEIDTNRLLLNKNLPNIFIEETEIDGEIFKPEEIRAIEHNTQRLIFRFAALSFINPEYNQYEFILEGFDSKWREIGNNHEAVYSALPPGKYTLQVRASNNDGYFNTTPASISFEIVPPFWQTIWFYLSVTALFIFLLIGGVRYRLRNIQKNNRQLQKMVNERTEELSVSNQELKKHIDDKNKLQSILAHDLRNPFSAILGYIELVKNEFDETGDTEHVEMMNMLLDSGRNTLNLLENLLQWSGTKDGGLEAHFQIIDITELVNEAIAMTEAQSTFKNIFVRNKIEEPHFVRADRNMILSVVRNLLSNAIKFSGRDSIVEIYLQEKDDKVIISVEDSGVGISGEELNNIFSSDKVQQKVGTQGEKGIGMGLMLCKEFIQKHDEEIWVTSTAKKGSTFSFSLKKAHEYEEKVSRQNDRS